MTRTAFVIAGGGSSGSVQVGMLRALVRHDVMPDLVVGASVSAINAAYFAGKLSATTLRVTRTENASGRTPTSTSRPLAGTVRTACQWGKVRRRPAVLDDLERPPLPESERGNRGEVRSGRPGRCRESGAELAKDRAQRGCGPLADRSSHHGVIPSVRDRWGPPRALNSTSCSGPWVRLVLLPWKGDLVF